MDYRYGSHTVFQIEYHFVWVTKYRYKVLTGEVAERVRALVRETCEAFEIRIISGVVKRAQQRKSLRSASQHDVSLVPSFSCAAQCAEGSKSGGHC